MSKTKRLLLPLIAGLLGSGLLAAVRYIIFLWAAGPELALDLFIEDGGIVFPMIAAFGVQVALYVVLRKRLFVPMDSAGPSGIITGASGGISSAAMVACCAHRVADLAPILGVTALAAFMTEYQMIFMWVGLVSSLAGTLIMAVILGREWRRAVGQIALVGELR